MSGFAAHYLSCLRTGFFSSFSTTEEGHKDRSKEESASLDEQKGDGGPSLSKAELPQRGHFLEDSDSKI